MSSVCGQYPLHLAHKRYIRHSRSAIRPSEARHELLWYRVSFRLLFCQRISIVFFLPLAATNLGVYTSSHKTNARKRQRWILYSHDSHWRRTFVVIPSISLSTTYAQLAVGIHKGFEHTRSLNPNCDSLERVLAGLETNGRKALALASVSATTATTLQALGMSTHVLGINNIYGGTFRYMSKVASQLQGLETAFVDFNSATDEELIWGETLTNPTLRLPPIAHITSLIHSLPAASRPLIAIDSIVLPPFYDSPLAAPISSDLAVHSITINQRPLRRTHGGYHPPERLHRQSTR
ncbi:hypothetical protein M422DRAFT_267200 [Sphaerobolus stellatus SS14]|uniref:cystathionine gamma-lyase n=1 Tax=Sphaerobolus stellatus (strain SS14) TaxID=990650 RepID=A0A0C9U9E6_SPHS4|nr:hypothetical protein M422DRAFT_267200 [Sphaerobolus stellatus SS14]